MKNNLVFLDTECGGLDDSTRPLIEIGWAVEDGPIQTLVVPHDLRACDPMALELNGYYERGLWDARKWAPHHEVLHLWGELQDCTLVCSNPSFDERFLLAYARAEGVTAWSPYKGNHADPWKHRKIDIAAYAMPILGHDRPQGLATVIRELAALGYEIEAPDHSVIGDVTVLRQAYRALQVMSEQLRFPQRFVMPWVPEATS